MRLRGLAVVVVALAVRAASADTALVILGPATDGKVPADSVDKAKKALAPLAKLGDKVIDTTCAADSACLIAAGGDAHRAVGIALTSRGATIGVGLLLVDVDGKELIAKRDLAIAPAKLPKDLAAAVKKLVDTGPVERARDLFAQAGKHFNLGELQQALELYKRAYRVKALPAFLFNIAQCHRKLGQHKDAIVMYQSYLVGVPDADNRKLVESLIEESKAALAEERRIADKRASEAARLEEERITADKKRSEDARKAKEAEAAAAAERRKTEEARLAAQRQRELDKQYNHHPTRKFALAGGSLGAAGMIAGGVFALLGNKAQSAFDSAGCGDPDNRRLTQAQYDRCAADLDKGQKDIRLRNLLLASGGGVLAASLIVFVIDPGNVPRPGRERAAVIVGPGSIQAVVRW